MCPCQVLEVTRGSQRKYPLRILDGANSVCMIRHQFYFQVITQYELIDPHWFGAAKMHKWGSTNKNTFFQKWSKRGRNNWI